MRRRADSDTEPTAPKGMRMAELARRSGVTRETIHFYLREGLLPRPEKGGRTVAYYGEAHLDRLRLIRRLRDEKYLPIAVIRRLLESPAAAAERDVDVLADVLHLIPADEESARAPSAGALAEAEARRLLGRAQRPIAGDPAERRVLRVIDDTLALEGDARRLTLDDLDASAWLNSFAEEERERVLETWTQAVATGDEYEIDPALGFASSSPTIRNFCTRPSLRLKVTAAPKATVSFDGGPATS